MSNEYASSADRGSSSEVAARSVDPGKTARTSALAPSASRSSAVQLSRGGATAARSAEPVDDPFSLHLPASADQIAATAGANGIQLKRDAAVQLAGDGAGLSDDQVVDTAHRGVSGPGQALPHADVIQRSFGRHDVGGIDAHVGGAAADAATSMGAVAYATGNAVAFSGAPDLHTAAHEAAHVVQQRAGVSFKGVGQVGDRYEQHADAVADAVVAGGSAESLLDQMAGGSASVQQKAGDSVQRIEDEALAARADAPEAAASGAAPAAEPDAVGVFISYVKLAALPDWMPEIASHCFIAFDDGWTAGFTKVGDDSKTDARVHIPEPRAAESGVHRVEARRKSDATSRGKTSAQIKQQIKTYAETVSPGRYNLITNNCGMWVKRALGQAWLVPETPGYVY